MCPTHMLTRKLLLAAGLSLLVADISTAFAETGPYYPGGQPTGMGLVSISRKDSAGNALIYGGSTEGQPDNWSFAPFNSTGDFGPFSYVQSTDEWDAGNGTAGVRYYPQRSNRLFGVGFAQDGRYIPCSDSGGNPNEYDIYSTPNGAANADNPQMYPKAFNYTPTIDKINQYNMSGRFTLIGQRYSGVNNQCRVNQAGALIGIELSNISVLPYQHFFYQIGLTNFCYDDGAQNSAYKFCKAVNDNPTPGWFWTGTAQPNPHTEAGNGSTDFGYNDTLTSYGGNGFITDNSQHGLALNVMPKIKNLILNNPYGMDKDLSHWFANPGVVGQALWGNVYLETRWDGWIPVYSLN